MGKLENKAMKNLVILSLVSLIFLQLAVEAIFLPPILSTAIIGALAVKKGIIIGSLLSQGRTRTQNTYRGKRFATEIDMADLERYKREVADKFMADDWYMELVEKDQDDCTKRLICEVSHKKASGKLLNSVENLVMEIFGKGQSVDTSKSTAIFDFAAQAGKYWKADGVGCEFYRRCGTPVEDILAMIETELDYFEQLEQSTKAKKMGDEKHHGEEELQSLDSDIVLQ